MSPRRPGRALSQDYEVGRTGYCDLISSADGTRKYLFPFGPGVEAVMIPDGDRHTVCVSFADGLPDGLPLLHDRPAGLARQPDSGGDTVAVHGDRRGGPR